VRRARDRERRRLALRVIPRLSAELPIHRIRGAFDEALAASSAEVRRPVVLSSPTGSGKSTEVPRWCPGRVLVIEPRRIACRSLAARVAELEGTTPGEGVGYVVRDERVLREGTRIVFATPGIVLRDRALLASASTIVLDELHERSLEMDLLLALLPRRTRAALVVMSATLEADRVAKHLGGTLVVGEGRAFPVEIRHPSGQPLLPDAEGLAGRVRAAVEASARDPGDVLVFLPGKAEIEACAQALAGLPALVLPLHGELGLADQSRVFAGAARRKVILATNVAETSLTIPGIGVVIDSGLVRQTRYHDGRGFLTLVPIAEDSAAQRAGRAGRTGPGVCYRLWSAAARLEKITPPEIHRESLVPLVMAAAAWGERPEELPFLDAPKPYALEAARAELAAWGALAAGAEGPERPGLSETGRSLFSLPVEPRHARLLLAAREEGCVEDAIDLVAALSVTRPFFVEALASELAKDEDLRAAGCDATALIRAVRAARPDEHGLSAAAVRDARQARARLRRLEGLPEGSATTRPIARDALVRAAIAADPRAVHVARGRGRCANGGTELELARGSAVQRAANVEAIVVLDTRALGGGREQRVLVTAAMPVSLALAAQAGLGSERLGAVALEGKRVVATVERVLAGRVIATREEVPRGALARSALVTLLTRGSLFRGAIATTRERLERSALAARLATLGHPAGVPSEGPHELEAWLLARLEALGVESGDDLALLSERDVLAPELPYEARALLDRELPATVSVGDASYRAEYDLSKREVVLHMVKGSRRDPPPLAYLPAFPGLRVCVAGPRGMTVLRERGR
jgi:ATP-dependent helicase HrpB